MPVAGCLGRAGGSSASSTLADAQPTAGRRMRAAGLVCLGAGPGWSARTCARSVAPTSSAAPARLIVEVGDRMRPPARWRGSPPRRCPSPRWKRPPPSGSPCMPAPPHPRRETSRARPRRKRAVFRNAVSYAVELRLLDANPVNQTSNTTAVAQTVDRREDHRPHPGHRPARRRPRPQRPRRAPGSLLRLPVLRLPAPLRSRHAQGNRLPAPWPPLGPHRPGRLRRRAGKDWTDDGTARQQRGLKHRAQHETRSIPIPPVLVQMLRGHLKRYGTAPDGRIFRTARGGLIQDSAYSSSGPTPAPPRSPPPSKPPRSPGGPTTCGTPACPWP